MTARHKARKRALDLLYEADIRGVDANELIAERVSVPADDYAAVLVQGVTDRRTRIDEILDTHSQAWPVDRMPAVDRAVLRIAVFELLWNDDVPDAVVIDEAVQLATDLSTDDSPSFVNGLLGQVAQAKPRLLL